jgi:cullin-associated NEDD8-dissociated protein 1
VQALRYTLPDENEAFDSVLKGYLIDMLKTMLEDPDREIRRHAMSTLNSASHNRPELILGHLNYLMPYVMAEAVIKPELVREVQMGPFKHIIDDGLEVRKVQRNPHSRCTVALVTNKQLRPHMKHYMH